jgi:phosphoglycolate phosphatase
MRFELLIFDCDGVLVDSEPIVHRAFVESLAEFGVSLDYEHTLQEFSGACLSTRLGIIEERLGWTAPREFVRSFDRRLGKAMRQELRPISGILEALAQLHGPQCVASNGSHQDMRVRLGLAGLLSHFEPHLFSASEVARGKPHPDLFLYTARRMGILPGRCAAVEDSVTGVEAAVRAGMLVFGYAGLTSAVALEQRGAKVFEHMADLPTLLQQPNA